MRRLIIRIIIILVISFAGIELVLQAAHFVVRNRKVRAGITDPGAPVILCLGDSHTFGAGVKPEEAYPARVEAMLRGAGHRVNVVNLGAPGTNTSEIRRRLPELLKDYEPVAVIVFASVNNGWNRKDAAWSDKEDGLPVSLSTRAADFLGTRVRIIRGVTVIIHRLDWTGPEEETARDRDGNLVIHRREEPGSDESKDATYDRARRDLVAIIARIRAGHSTPLLMTYVTDPEYTFDMPNRLLRRAASTMNAALCDHDETIRPLFIRADGAMDKITRDKLFFPDMHPRAEGYEKIAENAMRSLEEAGVLDLLPEK
jgi:lysophospholipase L1-like esterase